MKTLIELFDDRPIENVLATEVFSPDRTIFLCPNFIMSNHQIKSSVQKYFNHRGLKTKLFFLESSMYNSSKLARQLNDIIRQYPDCVMDITGGTDAALFACGSVCEELDIPVFTYSRKQNRFYNIHNAEFADKLECTLKHTVEDCFMMAGGALRKGRVDNDILGRYMNFFDPFFETYLKYRNDWLRTINYIQQASQHKDDTPFSLDVDAPYSIKTDYGKRINAPKEVLYALEKIDFLKNLTISNDRIKFKFADSQIRTWLRDIGSVLELYVYKAFVDTGAFNDVISSAIVDWEGNNSQDDITNEIDVMAMKGTLPFFVSCKTCSIETEALNELAILRDRFGGKGARAIIVSTKRCQNITRHRASELGIEVIDLEDLKEGSIQNHLENLLVVK